MTQPKFAFALACFILLAGLNSFAQSPSLTPQIMSSQQQVKWTTGPATANLGEFAEMEIPAGYRLTDAPGARILLQRLKRPVPAGLVGLLVQETGDGWAVLEFVPTGFLTSSSAKRIDAPAILKTMWARIEDQNRLLMKKGQPPVKSIRWERAPEYDLTNNSIACAIRIEAPVEAIVNQSIRLLGRRGILVAASQQKAALAADAFPLNEISKHISFKQGQRYEDFQEGDKIASLDSYQLLTGDEQTPALTPTGWKAFFDQRTMIWIVSSLAVCIFVVVIYIVTREIRSIHARQSFRPVAARNGAEVKVRKARRSAKGGDASKTKRAFDYQKYYSDLMMQVSTRSYTGFVLKPNEETVEQAGNAPVVLPADGAAVGDTQKGAASELIARQKDFIEEQRRLMQQQTKLIEERSKLIEEKNQLLAKQTEMLENHLL